jgi:hypothetical protein
MTLLTLMLPAPEPPPFRLEEAPSERPEGARHVMVLGGPDEEDACESRVIVIDMA